MTLIQAILIAVLHGVTEFFPVSSTGQTLVYPALIGWNIDQYSTSFLPFLITFHIGTAAALLIYFGRDWLGIATSLMGMTTPEEREVARRLVFLIAVAIMPAAILGVLLDGVLSLLYGFMPIAACLLIINGIVMLMGEHMRHRNSERLIEDMSWREALIIGLWQCAALLPGISRSGMTIVGGLLLRFPHREAAHFSFLIATPIIIGAALLEVPRLVSAHTGISLIAWMAGLIAGVTAYLSLSFLMRYFRNHEFDVLDPFAYYCMLVGVIAPYIFLFM